MNQNETPFEINGIPINIYGGFWLRLAAAIADVIILLIPVCVWQYINSLNKMNYFYTFLPMQLLTLYYYVYLPKEQGGTPGKLILGMKIIRIDGRDLDWRSALIRYSVFFLLGLSVAVFMMLAILKVDNDIYMDMSWSKRSAYLNTFYPVASKVNLCLQFCWSLFGAIILVSNHRKRAIHDYMAGTVVVMDKYLKSIREVMNEKPAPERIRTNYYPGPEKTVEDTPDHSRYMPNSNDQSNTEL